MSVKHHLNDELLTGYAAGTLPEAFDLVIATHLSLSDESRAALGAHEAVGGCLLDDTQEVAMGAGALGATLARIRAGTGDAPAAPSPGAQPGVFPAPLRAYVGGDVEAVKWRPLGGGVRQAILPTRDRDATVRLLYIPAGQAVPDHGHHGRELTLVLQGAFSDAVARFARGDLEYADEDLEHQPVAEPGEDCICLAATDARLRFNALLPRMLQPLFRI